MESRAFETVRNALLESYKHKRRKGTRCGICGNQGRPVAIHVIEFAEKTPRGHIDGSVPVCNQCAPPCKKCDLPRVTGTVKRKLDSLQHKETTGIMYRWGAGVCQHAHILGFAL